MRKLIVFIFLAFMSMASNATTVAENTGFYGVYIKSMPFWTFWNYNKALLIIAESAQVSTGAAGYMINERMPILWTWDYEKAQQLKNELLQFNCDSEIREITFACTDKGIEAQLELAKFANKFNDIADSTTSLSDARQAMIELLEKEIKDSKD
ncbi:MAG: hypothetical protein WC707_04775 [Candidatus Babeliaceae bacterium]